MICGHCKATDVDTPHVRACSNTPGARPEHWTEALSFDGGVILTTPKHPVTEIGVYKLDGDFYRVRESGAGRLYAELIHAAKDGPVYFEYLKGMIYKLHAEDRCTLDDAREFGAAFGSCCVCGRTLTNPTSIEAGIGPICAGRL